MSARSAASLVLVAGLLALAACGSGDGQNRGDIGKAAATICRDINKKANALARPKAAGDTTGIARYYLLLAGLAATQHTRLNALHPADDVRSDWKAYMGVDGKITSTVQELAAAANARDAAKLQQATAQVTKLSPQVDAAAVKAGAKACASPSARG